MTRPHTVTNITQVDEAHQVITVEAPAEGAFCRYRVCRECPWRVSNTGNFPAGAFETSAHTAYDSARHAFACHMAGAEHSQVCAGFLLRNAVNNLGVRIAAATGRFDPDELVEPEEELHGSYREMAVANGVDPDNPVLLPCRDDDEWVTHD